LEVTRETIPTCPESRWGAYFPRQTGRYVAGRKIRGGKKNKSVPFSLLMNGGGAQAGTLTMVLAMLSQYNRKYLQAKCYDGPFCQK